MLPMLRNRLGPTFADDSLFGPWSDLRREIDRLFASAVPATFVGSSWLPAMDVQETQDAIRLTLEVPGVRPEELKLTVEHGLLTVSGEKRIEREHTNGATGFERRYGRFERTVTLPQSVDAERIAAHCEHGVLTIELPKTAEAKPRTIEISAAPEARQIEAKSGKRNAA
jgi:HSP20 family protein